MLKAKTTRLNRCSSQQRRQSSHKAEPSLQTTTNTCSTACSILFIPKYQNYITRILLTFTQMFLSHQDIQLKPNCLTVTQIFIYPKTQTSIQKHKKVSKNTKKVSLFITHILFTFTHIFISNQIVAQTHLSSQNTIV